MISLVWRLLLAGIPPLRHWWCIHADSVVSSVDILSSSVTLTHPKLPYIALIRSRERLPLLSLLGLTPTDIPLQIRNRQFSPFVSLGLTAQITDLLLAMHIYMITVHDHLTGHRPVHSDPGLAMGLICDRRNRIQYEILSLPSASEVQVLQLDSQLGLLADAEAEPFNPDVYEPTRLAILIYAVGVIRPVPGQHSPLGRLATLLRGSLQRSFPESENGSGGGDADREIWTSNKGRVLKFWILMLGCIAAERSPSPSPSPSPDLRPGSCSRQTSSEREWFVDQLGRTIVGDASIRNWDALRSVLVEMPWSGVACDGPGGRVWVEVEEWLLR